MSQDVFGRTDQDFGGSFSADGAKLLFAAGANSALAGTLVAGLKE